MEQYKGYLIYAWTVPHFRERCLSHGIVCKMRPRGSVLEVKRIQGRTFTTNEEAEAHGLEMCRTWIDEQASTEK